MLSRPTIALRRAAIASVAGSSLRNITRRCAGSRRAAAGNGLLATIEVNSRPERTRKSVATPSRLPASSSSSRSSSAGFLPALRKIRFPLCSRVRGLSRPSAEAKSRSADMANDLPATLTAGATRRRWAFRSVIAIEYLCLRHYGHRARTPALRTGYRQHRHDLDGFTREDREVRMVFEQLRGGFVRVRAHDGEGAHRVGDIRDAAWGYFLGLAERSTHADDRALVLFDPRLPRGHTLAFLCPPLLFGKRRPCSHLRAGFAAEKNGEIGIRAHDFRSPSDFCGLTASSRRAGEFALHRLNLATDREAHAGASVAHGVLQRRVQAGRGHGEGERYQAAFSEAAQHLLAQIVGLWRVAQGRLGEAHREGHVVRHGGKVARGHRPQDHGIDAGALRHVDCELRARPAILRHDGDDSGGGIDRERHVLAVAADAGHLAKRQKRARIGSEDVAQIARIVAPCALELGDPAPEQPSHHRCSPALLTNPAPVIRYLGRGSPHWAAAISHIWARAVAGYCPASPSTRRR